MLSRVMCALAVATLFVVSSYAQAQPDNNLTVVVPLDKMRAGQWVERVCGNPEKPGAVFAIRIHNDAGYIEVPHVHPMDEHFVVVQGV
jgi:hypothetical protein